MSEPLKQAEEAVDANSYDVAAWHFILNEAPKQPIGEARRLYDKALEVFPTAGAIWRDYLRIELQFRNFAQAKELLGRCLKTCPHVEKLAYTQLFKNVGVDFNVTPAWQNYIRVLKELPETTMHQEQTKTAELRQAYLEALASPKTHISQLRADLDAFAKPRGQVGRKLVDLVSGPYAKALTASRKVEGFVKGINRDLLAVPPTRSPIYEHQLRCWQEWIAFERTNPLALVPVEMVQRVICIYRQCLMYFRFYPNMWYDAVAFLEEAAADAQKRTEQDSCTRAVQGDTPMAQQWLSEARSFFEAGINALPQNFLLHFAFADWLEGQGHIADAREVYNRLLGQRDINPALPFVQFMKMERRVGSIESVRKVFKQARQDERTTFQAFVAAALLELNGSDKGRGVCSKIFELAVKRFPEDPGLARAYLAYLSYQGDNSNTRALFERVLSKLPPADADGILQRYIEFEGTHGDLSALKALERRRHITRLVVEKNDDPERAAPTVATFGDLVHRYQFLDLLPSDPSFLSAFAPEALSAVATENTATSLGSNSVEGTAVPADIPTMDAAVRFSEYPMPDTAQAVAYQPATDDVALLRLPRPRLVAELLTLLPPPEAYTVRLFAFSLTACCVLGGSGNSPNTIILVSCILGQHVAVEPLVRCILERDIPQPKQSETSGKREHDDADGEDETGAYNEDQEMDLFRQRQRVKRDAY
ncbi:uncharacterized protein MONBRDRAFT_22410 [Monosiga brevicollis MX1]|uniref:Suppressor of forked domain-containing protein n=1 Tax=Monosiga brevicollis TaxID=81824 RepID=A9UQH8_MONBE|nr:uncharacterized protein MONBRDRAFT_22410 [Monosiga brevicollis MX1]EDQ93047.1 predicted protein [Monosiga brevicollis MX1]|eukprot:XP_001742809.1 hypothetical protein [Monosiga brevicollis MX1]